MHLAGRPLDDPVGTVTEYVKRHTGTVTHYDAFSGDRSTITPALVKATRSPWMGSRISGDQERWLCERATTAPWDLLSPNRSLRELALPDDDDLGEQMTGLYGHFEWAAPRGVRWAKLHKPLHLIRPGVFPILDTKMERIYRDLARSIPKRVCGDGDVTAMTYWRAIAVDLDANWAELDVLGGQVKERLAGHEAAELAELVDALSPLRLLDIIAWQP